MVLRYNLPNAKENILAEIKIHTLRADRVNAWKPGRIIHHATGKRFAKGEENYNCFLENKCKSVQQVLLVLVKDALGNEYIKGTLIAERRRLTPEQVQKLVINDGFNNEQEMIDWFFKKTNQQMWSGKIIHWTSFKY